MQEVVDRQFAVQSDLTSGNHLPFNLQTLLDSLAGRQECLFEALVHFHQLDVVRLEDVLGEAERDLVAPLSGRYLDQQKLLHRLKVCGGVPGNCFHSYTCLAG